MEFFDYIFILLCLLEKINGLSLQLRNSCAVIENEVFLDCSIESATWNNASSRKWRVSPPTVLLFDKGNPTIDAAGYQEHISNVATTGIFSLEITTLSWSLAGKQFQCAYGFDTSILTLSNTDIEDYRNTVAKTTDETSGLNIKGTITLDAIYPVPTVQAMLSSSNSDISMKALTNTTSPAPGNLSKVVISVNHLVRNAADYITVNLSTPCGYSQSFRFNATDIETTTITTEETAITMKPPGEGLSTGEVIGIVIGVLFFIIIVVVVVVMYVCKYKKKDHTRQRRDKKSQGTLTQNVDESNNIEKKTT